VHRRQRTLPSGAIARGDRNTRATPLARRKVHMDKRIAALAARAAVRAL